jgi:hypothetical protein
MAHEHRSMGSLFCNRNEVTIAALGARVLGLLWRFIVQEQVLSARRRKPLVSDHHASRCPDCDQMWKEECRR